MSSAPAPTLSPGIEAWLQAEVGPVALLEVRGGAQHLRARRGELWLKRLRSERAWRQADAAYTQLVPALRDAGVGVPRCVARHPGERLLLLEAAEGRPATLSDPPATFARAGAAIHALHQLPCPPDLLPLPDALLRRAQAVGDRQRALQGVAIEVQQLLRHHRGRLDTPRCWCHRDHQPQNWVVTHDALTLLDFEHTRPDHPLVDWVRLEARGWAPAQRSAFAQAYGTIDPIALRCVLALYGLTTVAWARTHGDPQLSEIGRRALRSVGLSCGGARDIAAE